MNTNTRIACAAASEKNGARHARPLNLSAREQTDLVVLLETRTTFSNPWRPEDPNGRCH
jgi:hypothetical protein